MKIRSKIKNYAVEICEHILDDKKTITGDIKYNRLFYFIDANVYRYYKSKLKSLIDNDFYLTIEALESNKTYINIAEYYRALIDNNFTRNDILITIGGGILQDISGFIASTLYRGIKWIFLPTTLLAQADSCIGSKTSINFDNSKNLIGSFYPPDLIYIEPDFCLTLEEQYFNSGIGEIIKFHLMSDGGKYALLKKYLSSSDLKRGPLLREIIISTLKIKKAYFDKDEFDTGKRNLLNYGHCFGHALESATDFAICHGEAVLIGMGFANLLSLKRGIMPEQKYEELEQLLQAYYPHFDITSLDIEAIIKYLKRDKKRVGKDLTMILSSGIGEQFKYDDIKESEIRHIFKIFSENYKKIVSRI